MAYLPLFTQVADDHALHDMFLMIRDGDYEAERQLLLEWSDGFIDRDGKFCHEFQTTFHSCLWELYIHAFLKELNANIDFSFDAPDFVVEANQDFCIEATVAEPAKGEKAAFGYSMDDLPTDFNEFNQQATLRICNSFTSKVKKYRERYCKLPQSENKPFVLAIASYDRPFSHMAANRPIISALYGVYHDEMLTIGSQADEMISYNVSGVVKNENVDIALGYFCSDEYSDISAVIYSNLATWGKVRALADNPSAMSIYNTLHPNPGSLFPINKTAIKSDYLEHLSDGLCILHNPFAKHPLDTATLYHERIAQIYSDHEGELTTDAPDDFLLMRFIHSIKYK